LLTLLLAFAGVAVAQDAELGSGGGSYRWNDFGPSGGTCMDACGPNCTPNNCGEPEQLSVCHPDNANMVVSVTRYTCGTHPACSLHDECLETCRTAQGADYDSIDFFIGECQYKCHEDAADFAYQNTGQDPAATSVVIGSWIHGRNPGARLPVVLPVPVPGAGVPIPVPTPFRMEPPSNTIPWASMVTWDYSMDEPDGMEETESCPECRTCQDGRCKWNEEECGECNDCNDVHMQTLDGLRYNFQAAGEFVLFENDARTMVVQARTSPLNDWVSVNTAAAMMVGSDRVAFYRNETMALRVNGTLTEVANNQTLTLPAGGTIRRSGDRHFVRWPDNSLVMISDQRRFLNVWTHIEDRHRGSLVGLLGDFDGDASNDLFPRGGDALSRRTAWNKEVLYGRYANSWRITHEESLFDYDIGETTETYQLLDFPYGKRSLYDVDRADLEAAEQACLARGLTAPRLLRDCIYDVAMTGDPDFALGYEDLGSPAMAVPPDYFDSVPASNIAISAVRTTGINSDVEVTISGDRLPGDFIAIAPVGATAGEHLASVVATKNRTARLAAPAEVGEYSLRYVRGNDVVSNLPLSVLTVGATLDVPAVAVSGATVEVDWQGPGDRRDYVSVARPSMPVHEFYTFTRPKAGKPLRIKMPTVTGRYQVRYVHGATGTILDYGEIDVEEVIATLEAPGTVISGSLVDVSWTGPGNRQDMIVIVDPSLPDGEQSYGRRGWASQGSPVAVEAPDEPGNYELRYVQEETRRILARRPLEVTAVTATLEAPNSIGSGARIEVTWTGPGNRMDKIVIVDPSLPAEEQSYQRRAWTRQGSPLEVEVPDDPGNYELLYVQGQSNTILARRAFEVTAATATLDAPNSIGSGARIEVAWTGPGNPQDKIVIVDPSLPAEEQSYQRRAWTRQGSPLEVEVPDDPGNYELLYVQGQSNEILARHAFEVTAATATLDATNSIGSGARIEVTWTGPGNRQDMIAIVDPSLPEDEQSYQRRGWTRQGSPLEVEVPDEPGSYELLYVQGQSKTILARHAFEVTAATATLDAPGTAVSGADVAVTWTGPANRQDMIAIVDPSLPEEEQSYQRRGWTRQGSPVAVQAPDEPGTYEIRYVQGQSKTVLARRDLVVTSGQ